MKFAETTLAPHDGGNPGRLQLFLLAVTVHLAGSAPVFAGGAGDSLVVRSGGAELRSASRREAGKVPVVFVHGMLGSPGNWSVMIDRLAADPSVRERFQFLTFGYDSLQPIPDSGRELLEALGEARRRLDPEDRDDSFNRVVVVGHSLGGLVAKEAAARAVGPVQGGPFRPRVGRIIFIATPHRGSPVDRGVVRSVGDWLARTVSPSTAARQAGGNPRAPCSMTSVDQLTWDHPFLLDLERSGAAAGVPSHSIIAALTEPAVEGATDGLVPVASARLGGARSEVVVRAAHACFEHPEVIREVHRVLGEHAAEPARPRAGPTFPQPTGVTERGQPPRSAPKHDVLASPREPAAREDGSPPQRPTHPSKSG
jgi:pimeloyl-ACP methyl ester carboxylesterase